jgi:signal transduction histidine kinase
MPLPSTDPDARRFPDPPVHGDSIPLEQLRALPFLSSLPEEELRGLAAHGRRLEVPRGTLLIRQGDPGKGLYILIEGEMEVLRRGDGPEMMLGLHGPGALAGELSLLEGMPANASVRAARRCEVLAIPPEDFHGLLAASPRLCLALLRMALERLRSTEAGLIQREKLASLGTLAAGLAHQVNNPASAVRRGALQLSAALDAWERASARLGREMGGEEELTRIQDRRSRESPGVGPVRSGFSSLEEERCLEGWMAELGIRDAPLLAAELAGSGWTLPGILEAFPELAPPTPETSPPLGEALLRWLASRGEVDQILAMMAESARVISEVVEAVRSHARVEASPVHEVEMEASLRHALGLLGARLPPEVRVEWTLLETPVQVAARGSELSHVWVNLMENALEAMGPSGTLGLRIGRAGDGVVVEVCDTGPGIPEAFRDRIFDPFFTTKPPGRGMGLGLHIARSIVVNQYRGRLEVASGPVGTTFRVCLPLLPPSGE